MLKVFYFQVKIISFPLLDNHKTLIKHYLVLVKTINKYTYIVIYISFSFHNSLLSTVDRKKNNSQGKNAFALFVGDYN